MLLRGFIPTATHSPSGRIRARLVTVALLAVAIGGLCSLHAERPSKVKKESKRVESRQIESLEEQWRTAILHADATTLDKLLADDFLAISANGTLSDKSQYLKRIGSKQYEFTTIDATDTKFRFLATTAIVVSQAHVIGQLDGHPINGIYRYTKVYDRSAGPWRLINSEATRVSGPRADDLEMHRGTPLRPGTPVARDEQQKAPR